MAADHRVLAAQKSSLGICTCRLPRRPSAALGCRAHEEKFQPCYPTVRSYLTEPEHNPYLWHTKARTAALISGIGRGRCDGRSCCDHIFAGATDVGVVTTFSAVLTEERAHLASRGRSFRSRSHRGTGGLAARGRTRPRAERASLGGRARSAVLLSCAPSSGVSEQSIGAMG